MNTANFVNPHPSFRKTMSGALRAPPPLFLLLPSFPLLSSPLLLLFCFLMHFSAWFLSVSSLPLFASLFITPLPPYPLPLPPFLSSQSQAFLSLASLISVCESVVHSFGCSVSTVGTQYLLDLPLLQTWVPALQRQCFGPHWPRREALSVAATPLRGRLQLAVSRVKVLLPPDAIVGSFIRLSIEVRATA